MKTSKLIFSIVLLALGTAAFSQDSFSDRENGEEFIQVKYTTENTRISHRVGDFLNNFLRPEKTPSLEPVVSMSFILDQPDVVYEEIYCLESWMITPFLFDAPEAELYLEPWMGKPFSYNIVETGLTVESWMSSPFEASESTEVESWMHTAWL